MENLVEIIVYAKTKTSTALYGVNEPWCFAYTVYAARNINSNSVEDHYCPHTEKANPCMRPMLR